MAATEMSFYEHFLAAPLSGAEAIREIVSQGRSVADLNQQDPYDERMAPEAFWELLEANQEYMEPAIERIAGWFERGLKKLQKKGLTAAEHNVLVMRPGDVPEVFDVNATRLERAGARLKVRSMEEDWNSFIEGSYHRADEIKLKPFPALHEECPVDAGLFFWQSIVALAVRRALENADLSMLSEDARYVLFVGPNEAPYTYIGTLTAAGWNWEHVEVVWE